MEHNNSKANDGDEFQVANWSLFTIIIPILSLFPIVVNLFNAHELSKIKFKAKTFQNIKLNSKIDAILFLTILLQPFFEELCSKLWRNNYLTMAYKVYILSYLTSALNTVGSLICLVNAWNRYKMMANDKYNFSKYKLENIYSIVILFIFVFSFVFYLPNIFLNSIVLQSESSHVYTLKIANYNLFIAFGVLQFIVSFIIFMISLVLVLKLGLIIKKQRNFTTNFDQKQMCQSFSSIEKGMFLRKASTKKLNKKTSRLVFFFTCIFSVDQLIKTLGIISLLFVKRQTGNFFILFIVYFFAIFTTQIVHACIFFKFIRLFSRRLKHLITFINSKQSNSMSLNLN